MQKNLKKTWLILLAEMFTLAAFFLLGCTRPVTVDIQDLEVYISKGSYVVQGKIDRREIFKSNSAGMAIQHAIDHLSGGGTVYLSTGEYPITGQIELASNATLEGAGAASEIITDELQDSAAVVMNGLNKSAVKNFSIKNRNRNPKAKIGVWIGNCGDCLIEDITAVRLADHGIRMEDRTFLSEIRGCRIAGTGKAGIMCYQLTNGGRGGDWVPILVSNCLIYDCGKGIEAHNAVLLNIDCCAVYRSHGPGYHLHSESNSISLTSSRTFQIDGIALLIEAAHEINIASNIFCWSVREGMVIDSVTWGTIVGNNVIDVGSLNLYDPETQPFEKYKPGRSAKLAEPAPEPGQPYDGIQLRNECQALTITGNAIFNWPVVPPMENGISEDATCRYNLIMGNNINYCLNGISSRGKFTKVGMNQVYGEESLIGWGPTPPRLYQYFDHRLMEVFIDEIVE